MSYFACRRILFFRKFSPKDTSKVPTSAKSLYTVTGQNRYLADAQKRYACYLNKVTLLGYVGGDPEVHQFSDGTITTFSLAVSNGYTKKATGERVDYTDWFKVCIYNEKLQEIASQLIGKGARVYLEGQLRNRKWTDSVGQERMSVEVQLRHKSELIVLQRPAFPAPPTAQGGDSPRLEEE
ncbi:single-stranded DNA-binding protein-like isoform X3 [Schistocerca gregaria]|uniref:single-stranded DNA-binding protein-like isoform X3 n=1 Tax=Schistocerca gregaria TaxID=7010 RepID=UPI00211E173A|nr:single-stranded DNA-binding protein-like isoform X3 [Schistocerca gregaria]